MLNENNASLPKGSIDCHMHIYGPSNRFPPETTNGLCNRAHLHHYLALREELNLSRTVYVQPSHYERDNSCMIDAMASDPAEARGVAVVGVEAATSEFKLLNDIGVRGARFSFLFSGCLTYEELDPVANRIADFNWHAQLQLDGNELPLLERQLKALPVPIVIDHLGRIPVTGSINSDAHSALYRLLDTGKCWVKLSAPYHVSKDTTGNCSDVAPLARYLIANYPDRLLWGSNWPHPNALSNPPDDKRLLQLFSEWCASDKIVHQILVENPERLYDFAQVAD